MSEVFLPNEYQLAVFKFIKEETGHCVVEAVAGSGKTVTIVKALNLVPHRKKCAFVAFNKHIAEELQRKAPKKVQVMTLHSMGFKAIKDKNKNVKLDSNKIYKISKEYVKNIQFDDWKDKSKAISTTSKIISLLKGNLLEPTPNNITSLMNYHGIEECSYQGLFDMVRSVFDMSVRDESTIDFDDMIFMPIWNGFPLRKYDYLFVDEAQDLNAAQLHLVLCSIKKDGRVIAVGDRNQSIYGFRGADVESIPKIIKHLDATVLPLSITYRCPKSHVENAQRFVPEITATPNAEDGKICNKSYDDFYELVQEDDLCLCRNNAPLLNPCMNLIQQGRKAIVKGRDIGKGLISLIKEMKSRDLDMLRNAINIWEAAEFAKARTNEQNPQTIEDKANCIKILIDSSNTNSIQSLIGYIEGLFSDDKAEITFSSIHKAKGLEADNVFILEPQLMPSPYAEQDWEIIQEQNIEYVAITRAKKNLYFIS